MKQQLLEQEVRDLKAYIEKLEDAIIQDGRPVALLVIRAKKRDEAKKGV